jgi:phenylalanyl-tRNA synthetase beta chain
MVTGGLGFTVKPGAAALHVDVPTWRSTGDVSLAHDLVEEVARLCGYDNFEFVPPQIRLERQATDRRLLLERRVKELLALLGGMKEVVTYPWVKDRYLEAAGFDVSDLLRISSPPAPDQSGLLPSLIPSLLQAIITNQRYFQSFRIFQAAPVFINSEFARVDDPAESLPQQPRHVAAALVGGDPHQMFREAKGLIEALRRLAHPSCRGGAGPSSVFSSDRACCRRQGAQ